MTITLPQANATTPTPVLGESYSCLDIVKGALRKVGVLASGREPRAADRDDVFQSLKSLYRQWINSGAFGRLCDVTPLTDYMASPNQRIFRNQADAIQITLPEMVRNWNFWKDYRINGIYPNEPVIYPLNSLSDATTPRDCSVITITDAFIGQTYDFIYDGQTKQWQGLYNLALEDPAPLAWRDHQGLMAALAVQIADEFSAQIGQSTAMRASSFITALTHRYSAPRVEAAGEYF